MNIVANFSEFLFILYFRLLDNTKDRCYNEPKVLLRAKHRTHRIKKEKFMHYNPDMYPKCTVPAADVARVKGLGFLRDKRTADCFNCRVITRNGKITAEEHRTVAEAAEKFGTGEVDCALTAPDGVIPWGAVVCFFFLFFFAIILYG